MLTYEERKIILNFSKNYQKKNKKQPSQYFSFKVNYNFNEYNFQNIKAKNKQEFEKNR